MAEVAKPEVQNAKYIADVQKSTSAIDTARQEYEAFKKQWTKKSGAEITGMC